MKINGEMGKRKENCAYDCECPITNQPYVTRAHCKRCGPSFSSPSARTFCSANALESEVVIMWCVSAL